MVAVLPTPSFLCKVAAIFNALTPGVIMLLYGNISFLLERQSMLYFFKPSLQLVSKNPGADYTFKYTLSSSHTSRTP